MRRNVIIETRSCFQLPIAIFDCAVYPRVLQVLQGLRVNLLCNSPPPSQTINEKTAPKSSNNRYNVHWMFNRAPTYYQRTDATEYDGRRAVGG